MFYIHWQLAVRIYGINKYDADDDDAADDEGTRCLHPQGMEIL
jgi:hypothetical protein